MREFSDGEAEELFSFEIEQAYQQKQSQYVSSDPAENFTIDFANMQETDHNSGEKTKVMRVDLLEGMCATSTYIVCVKVIRICLVVNMNFT